MRRAWLKFDSGYTCTVDLYERGFVRFQPARLLYGRDELQLATWEELMRAVAEVWAAVDELVDVDRLLDWDVTGADIARDFTLPPGAKPPVPARPARAEMKPYTGSNGISTGWLAAWGKENHKGMRAKFYDKHKQSKKRAPKGTWRFEVSLGSSKIYAPKWLGRVADLTPERIWTALEFGFERSGLGDPCYADPVISELANDAKKLNTLLAPSVANLRAQGAHITLRDARNQALEQFPKYRVDLRAGTVTALVAIQRRIVKNRRIVKKRVSANQNCKTTHGTGTTATPRNANGAPQHIAVVTGNDA
jgi:hypothetical protein